MIESLAAVTVLAPTYAEALAFFRDVLDFNVSEDRDLGLGKRWVVVEAPGGGGARIVLAVPGDDRQRARIGDQTGGRVGFFLFTNDFQADYEKLTARGVRFLEEPRPEPYGRVVVFADPWGGRWDLMQPSDIR
ncbi:MAG TPA: VOC family protein [Roseiarcus sp.]|nr:VOC family protein [Roseiarcus sp.]